MPIPYTVRKIDDWYEVGFDNYGTWCQTAKFLCRNLADIFADVLNNKSHIVPGPVPDGD